MTPEEHSILLYLMDGLTNAPNKADELLNAPVKLEASLAYSMVISRLKLAAMTKSLPTEIMLIRKEIL